MIKVSLNDEQLSELQNFRGLASSENSEKALMIILNSQGNSAPEIAEQLKRNSHTVRKWLKSYIADGIEGLGRNYSPGRPDELRQRIIGLLDDVIENSPREFGYQVELWTVNLLVDYLTTHCDIDTGRDTVLRALDDMGYKYKRSAAGVSSAAPSRQEKEAHLCQMIEEIQTLIADGDCEIFALDETYLSNEPYVIQGWQKKRWPPKSSGSQTAGEDHIVRLVESGDTEILLEKRSKR